MSKLLVVAMSLVLWSSVGLAQPLPPPTAPPPPPGDFEPYTGPGTAGPDAPVPPDGEPHLANPRLEPAPPVEVPARERYVGLHIGLNLGLFMIDGQSDRFYGFLAGNAGIPLVTNGTIGAFTAGAGYNFAISKPAPTMWFMDFTAFAPLGWQRLSSCTPFDCSVGPQFYGGVGAAVGFRLLHVSGFTLGFKLPVFGITFGPGLSGSDFGSSSVSLFYLATLIGLPVVSFGFRF